MAREGELRIGTSGWTYDVWADDFYDDVPRRRWLEHYAQHFNAVEVNATFYHTLKPTTFAHWHDATPAGFRFAIKASRYLTHVQRLELSRASLAKQREIDVGQIDARGAPDVRAPNEIAQELVVQGNADGLVIPELDADESVYRLDVVIARHPAGADRPDRLIGDH